MCINFSLVPCMLHVVPSSSSMCGYLKPAFYFVPLSSKYSPPYVVLKHCQSVFFLQCFRLGKQNGSDHSFSIIIFILTFMFSWDFKISRCCVVDTMLVVQSWDEPARLPYSFYNLDFKKFFNYCLFAENFLYYNCCLDSSSLFHAVSLSFLNILSKSDQNGLHFANMP